MILIGGSSFVYASLNEGTVKVSGNYSVQKDYGYRGKNNALVSAVATRSFSYGTVFQGDSVGTSTSSPNSSSVCAKVSWYSLKDNTSKLFTAYGASSANAAGKGTWTHATKKIVHYADAEQNQFQYSSTYNATCSRV